MNELIIRIPDDVDFKGIRDYYMTNLGRRILENEAALGGPVLEFTYQHITERTKP